MIEQEDTVPDEGADVAAVVETPQEQAPPERDYEAEARENGWTPKEDFRGEPERWKDAKTFVEDGERILPIVRSQLAKTREELARERKAFDERVERMEKIQRETLDRQKRQHEAELAAVVQRQRHAVEMGDTAAYDSLERERARLSAERIEVPEPPKAEPVDMEAKFRAENPWYGDDFEMTVEAQRFSQHLAHFKGVQGDDNARQVVEHIKQKFADRLGGAKKPQRPAHAAVDGGSPFGAPKETGPASKLNKQERDMAAKDVAAGLYKDINEWATVYYGR